MSESAGAWDSRDGSGVKKKNSRCQAGAPDCRRGHSLHVDGCSAGLLSGVNWQAVTPSDYQRRLRKLRRIGLASLWSAGSKRTLSLCVCVSLSLPRTHVFETSRSWLKWSEVKKVGMRKVNAAFVAPRRSSVCLWASNRVELQLELQGCELEKPQSFRTDRPFLALGLLCLGQRLWTWSYIEVSLSTKAKEMKPIHRSGNSGAARCIV